MYLRKELHPQGYCSVFAFIHSPLRGLGFCVGLVPNAYHINTATYAYLAPRMAWHLSNCERANTVRQYVNGTTQLALPTLYYYYKPMLVLCQYPLGQFVSQSRFVLCVYIKMFYICIGLSSPCLKNRSSPRSPRLYLIRNTEYLIPNIFAHSFSVCVSSLYVIGCHAT